MFRPTTGEGTKPSAGSAVSSGPKVISLRTQNRTSNRKLYFKMDPRVRSGQAASCATFSGALEVVVKHDEQLERYNLVLDNNHYELVS